LQAPEDRKWQEKYSGGLAHCLDRRDKTLHALACRQHAGGFSKGQEQQIAIARNLIKNAPVLIFDEADSAHEASPRAAYYHVSSRWIGVLPVL
jgi:ABC-type transport system involved in cytochrome bd biosynthesis fused ATPase/permease subunit